MDLLLEIRLIIYLIMLMTGKNNIIADSAMLNTMPEHRDYTESAGVLIGNNNHIFDLVTISGGTTSHTYIGNNCMILAKAHISHDCMIFDNVVISAGVILGGSVHVGTGTNIGMGAIVHQGVKIPNNCMIGMGTIITKKTELKPNGKYVGNPARYIGENTRTV